MFNTHITRVTEGPRYPQTITEKRAPTDESVRLLREMEEAAEKRVIERGQSHDNVLNFSWCVIQDPCMFTRTCICRYKLNGHDREVKFNVTEGGFSTPQEKAKKMLEIVSSKISEELLIELFNRERSIFTERNQIV